MIHVVSNGENEG